MVFQENEPLSDREQEILRLVATGVTNKEIAVALRISPNTVKVHLRNIFAKIGVVSRTEATIYAIKNGLVKTPNLTENAINGTADQIIFTTSPLAGLSDSSQEPKKESKSPPSFWPWILIIAGVAMLSLLALAILNARLINPLEANAPIPTADQASRWSSLPPMPLALYGSSTASFAGTIYLIGGRDQNGVYPGSMAYDPNTSQWRSLAAKPTPVAETDAAIIQEKVYVPGGINNDGKAVRNLEAYDIQTDSWESLAPLPNPISRAAVVAFEGKLYVIGGWNNGIYSDKIYIYNIEDDQWIAGPHLPSPRASTAATVMEGFIIIAGGENQDGLLSEVIKYFPYRETTSTTPFEFGPSLPDKRTAATALFFTNVVYLMGGLDGTGMNTPNLVIDTALTEWREIDPNTQPIPDDSMAVASGNLIHILGGKMNGLATNAHLSYQAIYTVTLPLTTNN